MKKTLVRLMCGLVSLLLLASPALAAEAAPQKEVELLSYADSLAYFDFEKAAYNWCVNFGMDPAAQQREAIDAILAGTDPRLIRGLATFSRDTGHGGERLVVTNAFRPACYQEVIGLHDGYAGVGTYRSALKWNGLGVQDFWWKAERDPGWPARYTLELREYDVSTLDIRYFYRKALRLWDNTWMNGYYARPGCSAHNSGTAIDLQNFWIAANFNTVYTYNGVDYDMADYGLYKPLQPGEGTAGETWHITCSQNVLALGNYDGALRAGYEIVYALYYNPASRGWSMADGRGIYLGAGVAAIQLRLCQLGLLEQRFITGYYCSRTEEAIKTFQSKNGLTADGICGGGTTRLLFPDTTPVPDGTPPTLTDAQIRGVEPDRITLYLRGEDDTRLNAFRVDTLRKGDEAWVERYYNAPAGGSGQVEVDIWKEGLYTLRAAACDAGGTESQLLDLGEVFVDTTPPRILELSLHDITESGFALTARAEDNGEIAGFTVTLTSDTGEVRENFLLSNGRGDHPWIAEDLTEGTWNISVEAADRCGNTASYTFRYAYQSGTALPGVRITYFAPANGE